MTAPTSSPAEQNDETPDTKDDRDKLGRLVFRVLYDNGVSFSSALLIPELVDAILAAGFRPFSPAATTREETVPAPTNESDDAAKPERKHEGHGLCGLLEVNGHHETAETVCRVLFPVPKGDE